MYYTQSHIDSFSIDYGPFAGNLKSVNIIRMLRIFNISTMSGRQDVDSYIPKGSSA